MHILPALIQEHNEYRLADHQRSFNALSEQLASSNTPIKSVSLAEIIVARLMQFQVAIPSWALGTGGTRFGRFTEGGEPRSLEEKIADVGILNALNRSSNAISLHIPWDIPRDAIGILQLAESYQLRFDAMNSNTFQDQHGQAFSYKYGSLQHTDPSVRQQAIDHNLEVIKHGVALGSKSITVWLSDGSSFPGQLNFRNAFERVLEGLQQIYQALPDDWKMFVEYKAFEPNFYSMTVGDWGQSLLYTQKLGPKANTLVDLGHHLPNANIEQIVALLMMEGKLGGFHFNDSKYGDDDLTAGSIRPYQLFLIFKELVEGMNHRDMNHSSSLAWMIDASHNIKDPLEDLMQSVEAILLAYAQALVLDFEALGQAQLQNDVTLCQEILQDAFRKDLRPLVAEARLRSGGALAPLSFFRDHQIRTKLIQARGKQQTATGL
jgi:L-rhamnose isomerase/sugar isomerase